MDELPDELLEIIKPEQHEFRYIVRGIRVEICAGCELDFRIRLMKARTQITLAINGLPGTGNRQPATGDGDGERRTGETPVPRGGQEMIGDEDPFGDGGEDDEAGPEIGGMECAGEERFGVASATGAEWLEWDEQRQSREA